MFDVVFNCKHHILLLNTCQRDIRSLCVHFFFFLLLSSEWFWLYFFPLNFYSFSHLDVILCTMFNNNFNQHPSHSMWKTFSNISHNAIERGKKKILFKYNENKKHGLSYGIYISLVTQLNWVLFAGTSFISAVISDASFNVYNNNNYHHNNKKKPR